MLEILLRLLPVFITIGIGYFCKRQKLVKKESGTFLLKLVFYVASPFLAYRAFSSVQLESSLLAYPLGAVILVVAYYCIAKFALRNSSLKPKQKAVVLMAYMIMNIGFALAFIIVLAGDEGVVRQQFFGIATGITTFGWVYSIAVKNGENKAKKGILKKKLLTSPPLWAMAIGIAVNLLGLSTPSQLLPLINPLADLTAPLILLALGILFEPTLKNYKISLQAAATRIIAGLVIGLGITQLFGLTGFDKAIFLFLATAPVGFNIITFASLEGLDEKLGVQIVSVGIITGIIWYPMLLMLFPF